MVLDGEGHHKDVRVSRPFTACRESAGDACSVRGPFGKSLDRQRADDGNVNVSGTREGGRANDQVHTSGGAGGIGQGEDHFPVDVAPLVPTPRGKDLASRVMSADEPPPKGARPGMRAPRVEQLATKLPISFAMLAHARTPRDGQVEPNAKSDGELGIQHIIPWLHRELSPCTGAHSPSTVN